MSGENPFGQIQSLEKLTLLNEIGRLVISADDLDSLFRSAAGLLKEKLNLRHVAIGTIDDENSRSLPQAPAGIAEGVVASKICIPFKFAETVVGNLNIESDRLAAFEQPDIEFFEAVGSFLGQAVHNARLREELEDSKNYLESVVRYAGDAIVAFDREGKIRTWNDAAELILGQPREAVMYRNVLELVQGPPESLQQIYDRILAGEVARGLQVQYADRQGLMRTLELSMAPVLDGRRGVTGVSCILRDVTAKIRAEIELQRKLEAEQLLNEVSVELSSILDLDRLLGRIAQIMRQFIDYELFAILLADQERQEFIWKTSVGYSEDSYRELQRLSIHEGVVGRVIRTRSPVIVDDVRQDPDYRIVRTMSGKDPQSMLAIPLIAKDRIIGVLVLESTQKAYFRFHHIRLLTPLATQIAVTIENANLYETKSRDALTKQVMFEIGKEMTGIRELDELLNRIAVLLRRAIEYEILGIFLYQPETESLELKVAIGYSEETVERYPRLRLGDGLLGLAAKERRTIVSTDLTQDARAIPAKTADGRVTRSEVAVPIVSRDRLLGGLVVESCDSHFFQPEHVQILETLASHVAVSIENAQLFQEVVSKEQKLAADFGMARDLQAGMLPAAMPLLEGYDMAALYSPAESLGGDYYDYVWLDNGMLGMAIGDVSGKGVAAAMTMAAARSALRFAARLHTSPSQVLYHVNRRLFRDIKKRTYVSLFYGVLEIASRSFRWSNGGHFPPILMRADGTCEELQKGGTVLALFDKSRYASAQTQLKGGDLLCFYTDGVIEARNLADEEFGKERLVDVLMRKASQPAKDILRAVSSELKKFSRGVEQYDDITLGILKVHGEQ